MGNDNILKIFESIFLSDGFKNILFRNSDVDFRFKYKSDSFTQLLDLLKEAGIKYEEAGKVITAQRVSQDRTSYLFSSYEDVFSRVYEQPGLVQTSNLLVLNTSGLYLYEAITGKEYFQHQPPQPEVSLMNNFTLYCSLLKIFKKSEFLVEFDDTIKSRFMIVDNRKDKNHVFVSYKIFDQRIFTKAISFDCSQIEGRINDANKPNNAEWLSIFRHNVINVISAQEDQNKTFSEIFINISLITQNTTKDYDIYLSGFSFEKISKELKEDRQKYFADLHQAQEKIKSQVISVPLAVGTTIYAFFQLSLSFTSFIFLLIMIGIYIIFIWWYLNLYERDLDRLRKDIDFQIKNFKDIYPKIYHLFKDDFDYIISKVGSVKALSFAIKTAIVFDWLALAAYVIFFYKERVSPPFIPKFVMVM